VGPRPGLDGRKISIRSRTVQPVDQSLYRLSYPAHKVHTDRRLSLTKYLEEQVSGTFVFTETLSGRKLRDSFEIRNILQALLRPRPVFA